MLRALVQHLLPSQCLHDLSLLLPESVCRLCPACRHTELSLYSYCPPRHGCLGPRTHPLPLHPGIQPPLHQPALGPLTPPRVLTLRFVGPNAPCLLTSASTQKWTHLWGQPAAFCLAQLCRRQSCSVCMVPGCFWLWGRSLSCKMEMKVRALEDDDFNPTAQAHHVPGLHCHLPIPTFPLGWVKPSYSPAASWLRLGIFPIGAATLLLPSSISPATVPSLTPLSRAAAPPHTSRSLAGLASPELPRSGQETNSAAALLV